MPTTSPYSYVLDASAFLALIHKETGYKKVDQILPWACISAVNFSEVVAKLTDRNGTDREICEILEIFKLPVIPFDYEHGFIAGLLRAETRSRGLSFGDRACLSVGIQRELTVITADKAWENLSLGIEIRMIR